MALSIEYEEIQSAFLAKITDYQILELSNVEIQELMSDWLSAACSRPYIRRLFSSFTNNADDEMIAFELFNPNDEDADKDYVKEVLAKAMTIEWLEPKVKSLINISQMFGGKEQKFFAQSNHLSTLETLLNETKTETRKLIRDRGYINNPYVNGESLGDTLAI